MKRPSPPLRYKILRRLQDGPASANELAALIDRGVGTVRFAVYILRCEGHNIRLIRRRLPNPTPSQYILEDHE